MTQPEIGPKTRAVLESFNGTKPATREEAIDRLTKVGSARAEDLTDAIPGLLTVVADMTRSVTGRGGAFPRPSPPDEKTAGDAKYVWRMLRFHLGIDVHMPVCADFYYRADGEESLRQKIDERKAIHRAKAEPFRDSRGLLLDAGYAAWRESEDADGELKALEKELRDKRKAKVTLLDAVVDYILYTRFPVKGYRGAMRWGAALGGF